MYLYLTADSIGLETGGGKVTLNESNALKSIGPTQVISRTELESVGGGRIEEPWGWDLKALKLVEGKTYKLCHAYAGTFPQTAKYLKSTGCKLTWTIAAHDKEVSRREHLDLGVAFPYPHLTEEPLWIKYISGYALADIIICPSTVAAITVEKYGVDFANKSIAVISHGCTLPSKVLPTPQRLTVGYMGSYGCDKGVRYLLEAWRKLDYKDATLVLAGSDSTSPWVRDLISKYGGGAIQLLGWVKDVSDFYNMISCYVQPSCTEGMGLEVLEALSYGRNVLCSEGAGAVDLVAVQNRFTACNVDSLASCINTNRNTSCDIAANINIACNFTWDKIKAMYTKLWRSL